MYDFLVIGAGSGGVRFARMIAARGFKVGIIEKDEIGGTCVLKGCIPKKLFIYAANFSKEMQLSKEYGWSGSLRDFNLWKFMTKKDTELKRLSNLYTNALKVNNVDIIKGEARFINDNTVIVNKDKKYTAKKFLITTGSMPRQLDIPGFNYTMDSTDFLNIKQIPKEALILGGGYIALEFTNILLSLGVKVNMFIRNNSNPLRLFDKSISAFIKEQLELQGVNFVNAKSITSIEKNNNSTLTATFDNQKKLTADIIINAVGRTANTHKLNLTAARVEYYDTNAIEVDDFFVTSNPNIYALGDVINKVNLTPVATKQAMYLVENLTTDKELKPFNYNFIPNTVFSYPEVASCGLTEDEAYYEMYSIDIYKSSFRTLKNSLTNTKVKSLFKIIVDSKTQKVLGMHIVDPNAGEIMQGFAVALKLGVTKQELDDVIGIHPTSAEELVTMYHKSE